MGQSNATHVQRSIQRLTTGETVTDWRRVWGKPANVEVAVEANSEEFLRRFVERVGRLAAARAS